jgi:hypothetical protein
VSAPTAAQAAHSGSLPESAWNRAARLGIDVAGATHLLAALDHFGHDPGFSVFFFVTGTAQLVVAHSVRRGVRPVTATAVLAGTVGLLLLYLVSRTVAVAIGPHADRPLDADLLGTVAVVAELVTVVALPTLLPRAWRSAAVNGLCAVGVAVWLAWMVGLLG